jgi:spoIIIJ-associated protein
MYKSLEITAASPEAAIANASEQLNIATNYLEAIISVSSKEEIKEYFVTIKNDFDLMNEAKKFIESILNALDIEPLMEFRTVKEYQEYQVRISAKDNNVAILIGKDGHTLQSITTIVQMFMSQFVTEQVKLTIDVNDYLKKKASPVIAEAVRGAQQVIKYRKDYKMRPMNGFMRKQIHEKLANYKHIKTESEGEAPNRYVVIKYED